MSVLQDKLREIAARIDDRVDGIAIIIAGDICYELGCVASRDPEWDAMVLAISMDQHVRMQATKPRKGFDKPSGEELS